VAPRLLAINNAVDRQATMVEGIASAAIERAQTPEEVVSAMSRIAEITRQTHAVMKDANDRVTYLAELSEQLRASVATFRLPEQVEQEVAAVAQHYRSP
jgi:twitching motility protein PilJ